MGKNNNVFKSAALLCMASVITACCMAQKGSSYLRLRVPVQYAWYKINVTVGVTELLGIKKRQSINAGAGVAYEYFLTDRLSAEAGAGLFSARFNVVRSYNRRFLGDLQAVNTVTYPRYKYSLLQLPLRVNYQLNKSSRLTCFIGAAHYVNFTYHQQYAPDGWLNKFYFFGNTVELNARLQVMAGKKIMLAVEPSVQVYNQWKKDVVVYDYGAYVREPPAGELHYFRQVFDAAGIAISAAIKL
jgi:hypothetical protein